MEWKPVDIISIILIIMCFILKMVGLDGDVSFAFLAIVVHYYGTAAAERLGKK